MQAVSMEKETTLRRKSDFGNKYPLTLSTTPLIGHTFYIFFVDLIIPDRIKFKFLSI